MSSWRSRPAGAMCCVTRNSSKVCPCSPACPGVGRDGVRAAALPKWDRGGCSPLALLSLQRAEENHKPPRTEFVCRGIPLLRAEVTPLSSVQERGGRLEWRASVGLGEAGTGGRKAPPAAAAPEAPGEMELNVWAAAATGHGEGRGWAGLTLPWPCQRCHGSLGLLPALPRALEGSGRKGPGQHLGSGSCERRWTQVQGTAAGPG